MPSPKNVVTGGMPPDGSHREPVNRRMPPRKRSASEDRPNAAIPASPKPPAASTARREIPFRAGTCNTRHRRGRRCTTTNGTTRSPTQACSVRTVQVPMVSSSPDATHRKPPVSAAVTPRLTRAANASRRQRPERIAFGADRRTLTTVAASNEPPSTACSVNTQAVSTAPARSERRPVAAIATTSTASTRSSAAWLMSVELCARYVSAVGRTAHYLGRQGATMCI